MKSVLKSITPAEARDILQNKNKKNRKLNTNMVTIFAREMTKGRWGITHQGIAFFDDGTLADGQHRLAAIVESGKTIEIMTSYGAKRESGIFMDTGRSRSLSDAITISDKADWMTAKIIQTAKLCYGVTKISADDAILLCENMRESLVFSHEVFKLQAKGVSTAIRAAIALAHFHGEDELRLMQFADMFYSGLITERRDTAVIKVRDYLLQGNNQSRFGGSIGRKVDFNKIQNAISKFCKHEPVKLLREVVELPYPQLKASKVTDKNK